MKKRIFSFLLAFCLTMALLPTNVLAVSTAKYELCWPLLTTVSGYNNITSSIVGLRTYFDSKKGKYVTDNHKGIDIGVTNATVLSTTDGVVSFVGRNDARGYYVVVYHEAIGLASVYQHLSSYSVEAGQKVVKGQEIAISGETGQVTGPHLHFELIEISSAPTDVNCPGGTAINGSKTSLISYEYRDTPADGSGSISPYFVCNVRINCINGQTVNLYNTPGAASRADYFSLGQTVSSTCGMARSDGATWYRITANQNGNPKTFWLKYESGKMTVTNLMSKGPYTLMPKCAPGTRLDVKGGSAEDGANVQIYTSNGTAAQQWELTYLDNGYYTITSKASGKALDVAGASTESGTNVQQYISNGTNSQQWMLKDAGEGYYYIVPKVNTGLCLDVTGAGTADKTNVGIYTANGTDAQKWKLDTPRASYTVTFDPNGGTVAKRFMTVTTGSVYGTLPTPIRGGYTFDGWYTSANGGIRMTSNTIAEPASSQTLYAHWTIQEHTHTNDAYFYSDSHPHYKFYTCATCGEVYTDESTATLSSCSVCNPPQNDTWGPWSSWSATPVSSSSTREVETQQVKVTDAYTEYRYGLWRNASNASWCPDYGASLSASGGSWYEAYTNWSEICMYQDTGHNTFCSGSSHNHTHVSGYDSSGRANWHIYSDDGTFTGWGRLYYYWEETRTIPATYETQYRYRDLITP